MRSLRTLHLLLPLSGCIATVVLLAAPAAADVNCSDLPTQAAAQAYLADHPGDPDHLDGDGDGRACEHNAPTHHTDWSLAGLGVLVVGALGGNLVGEGRRRRGAGSLVAEPLPLEAPFAAAGHRDALLTAARTGSLTQLGRALRAVPYADRMRLLEEHARARGSLPQDVLDELAEETEDLELQRWALAGFGPPSHVRLMHCPCVNGLRNFRLLTTREGVRSWTCATCRTTVAQRS